MDIKYKMLDPAAKVPTHGSDKAAGLDLYAMIPTGYVKIPPKGTVKVGTGIAIAIPDNYFGGIFARSGLATKHGLRPANCVGVIDSDYRGEVVVALHNDSELAQTVLTGDRIAQLVIIPCPTIDLVEGDISETARGANGFGSTGTN